MKYEINIGSYSKLKIIKNYLRSQILQTRMVGLAMISTENNISDQLDMKELILEN